MMESPGPFELQPSRLSALPIVDRFFGRMGLAARLERCLPAGDARVSLPTATAIGVLVRNLCLEREPLYGLATGPGPLSPGSSASRPGRQGCSTTTASAARWTSSSTPTAERC